MATLDGHGPTPGAFRGAVDGAHIWWVGKNYNAVKRQIWPDLKRATAGAWTEKSEVDHYIGLPGGGSVTVKSADNPDSLRGFGLDGVVIDEAAFCHQSLWSEVLWPMLIDRNGWAMFITTPNGPNWFYQLFRSAIGDGWERWQCPTSDNPLIKAEELEMVRKGNGEGSGPRVYAQEYCAQFTEEEGAGFPVEYFPDSIWFKADQWPETEFRYIACDPSLGRNQRADYSALVAVAVAPDPYDHRHTFYVRANLEKRPPSKIIVDSLRMCREFKPKVIGFEEINFQEVLAANFQEALHETTLDLEYAPIPRGPETAKAKYVYRWLDAPLADGRVKFLRGDRGTELLVDQLRGFPLQKYHDDGPDALAMAVHLADADFKGEVLRQPTSEERVYA